MRPRRPVPRKPVTVRKARIMTAILAGTLVVAGLGIWQAVADFRAVDACLDAGGAWAEAEERCIASQAEWDAYKEANP
ncbi:MAG: hypothetical protein ACFBWO_01470 [Paracoccaceae bacterium]